MNAIPSEMATLAGAERESFFAAQARHRRSAWRWSLAMAAVVGLITLAISLLLAPITVALIGLLLDIVNMAIPMPNLIGAAGRTLDAVTDTGNTIPILRIIGIGVLAAMPGLLTLVLVWLRLGRLVASGNHQALHELLALRDIRPGDFEERQLGNVMEEIAIAAGAPSPCLKVLDSDACNLGLLGDGEDSVLVVTRGVLDRLGRAETQALLAQAIAALGNGDGKLALRVLHLDLMVGLLTLLARVPVDEQARQALRPILRMRPGSGLEALRSVLGASGGTGEVTAAGDTEASGTGGDSRAWLWMPLAGSLLIGMLLVPISVALLVAPLNGLIWRRRRLLADATAVQFSRDPEALAEAYAELAKRQTALGVRLRGLGNLFLLDSGAQSNLRLGSPYPKLQTRVAHLNAMGSLVTLSERPRRPLWVWLVGVPLGVVVVGLCCVLVVLGTWLSLALNGLFLAIPTAVLHCLLRSVVH